MDEPIPKTVKPEENTQTEKKPAKMYLIINLRIIMKKNQSETSPNSQQQKFPNNQNYENFQNNFTTPKHEDNKINLNSVETNFSKDSSAYEVITLEDSYSASYKKKNYHKLQSNSN